MRRTELVLSLLLFGVPGAAMAQTPDAREEAAEVERQTDGIESKIPWANDILEVFDKPLHPVVGGVVSGGGLGAGIGYDSPDGQRWYQSADALVTVRRYWAVRAEAGRNFQHKRSQVGVFGGIRHMERLDFFGIGPGSSADNRAAFRLRESTAGVRAAHFVTPFVRLGGSAAIYVPDLGAGKHPGIPAVEALFSAADVPGISAQATFARYRAFTEFVLPGVSDITNPVPGERYQGTYQLAFESIQDQDTGRHSFHRWETELQQRIPGFASGHRLTLHGFLAATEQNSDVPFYLLYPLGGSGGLKAFRPDLMGSDETRATLRAYRNYRFRDRNLVLMQAEYRIPILKSVHATVFAESGQVAPRVSGLFSDLKSDAGFSLAYVRKGKSLGRMDVAFGGEGMRVFWSFGTFTD
jgi:hypothetical protein